VSHVQAETREGEGSSRESGNAPSRGPHALHRPSELIRATISSAETSFLAGGGFFLRKCNRRGEKS